MSWSPCLELGKAEGCRLLCGPRRAGPRAAAAGRSQGARPAGVAPRGLRPTRLPPLCRAARPTAYSPRCRATRPTANCLPPSRPLQGSEAFALSAPQGRSKTYFVHLGGIGKAIHPRGPQPEQQLLLCFVLLGRAVRPSSSQFLQDRCALRWQPLLGLPALCSLFGKKQCAPSVWITFRTLCPSAVGTTSAEDV